MEGLISKKDSVAKLAKAVPFPRLRPVLKQMLERDEAVRLRFSEISGLI